MKLTKMSYDEFGKLRFLDFFPETEVYSNDDVGGTTCGIGYGCVDGYAFTGFVSPAASPGMTAEISLDFKQDCPELEGHKFLAFLGLNLRRGMTCDEIKSLLGEPDKEYPSGPRFVLGATWLYYVGVGIEPTGGLHSVWICRKDLADKEDQTLNEI